jgi:hypothetical protein
LDYAAELEELVLSLVQSAAAPKKSFKKRVRFKIKTLTLQPVSIQEPTSFLNEVLPTD